MPGAALFLVLLHPVLMQLAWQAAWLRLQVMPDATGHTEAKEVIALAAAGKG